MFERLHTPEEAFNYKLGATLKMEEKVLEILDDSIEHAQEEKVKTALREHRHESEAHVKIVERVFELFGWEIDDSPCPTIEGLEKEAKATVKKSDDEIVDGIILQGAVEVEHHEIAVYENLIIQATAMGRDDVVELLRANIESEHSALEKVKELQGEIALKAKATA